MSDMNVSPLIPAPPQVSLFDLIAWVETKANHKAIRFEPATYARVAALRSAPVKIIIANIQNACKCSWGTALMIYSTSWGAAQIMGFNLYGPDVNYLASVVDFCDSEVAQKFAFVKMNLQTPHLKGVTSQNLADSGASRLAFALAYNGSANYADALVEALKHFGFSVSTN